MPTLSMAGSRRRKKPERTLPGRRADALLPFGESPGRVVELGQKPGVLDPPGQLDHGGDAELRGDLRAVELHRPFVDRQVPCDLLVRAALDHLGEDLALPRGQAIEPGPALAVSRTLLTLARVAGQGTSHRVEQLLFLRALGEKVLRPVLERAHGGWYVSVPAEKKNGQRIAGAGKRLLKVETAHPWHPEVSDDAARATS